MIRPLRDLIFVKPLERVKSNLIHVIMEERPNVGEIIATGPGKYNAKGRLIPLEVKPGQHIRYGDTDKNHLAFKEYEENGSKYLIMQEADVCFITEMEAA